MPRKTAALSALPRFRSRLLWWTVFERKDAKTQRRKDFDSDLCVLASWRLGVLASWRLGVSFFGPLEKWDIKQ